MTNKEIKQLIERLKRYAVKRGYPQLADDFAQEAFIALSRGRKAKTKHLFIDFLRSEYGDTRNIGGAARSRASFGSVELDLNGSGECLAAVGSTGGVRDSLVTDPRTEATSQLGQGWRDWLVLGRRDEEICFLRYDAELSEREIAEMFGVTESRVCQILGGRIAKAIERAATFDEMRLRYKEPDASLLEINWITV